LAVWGLVVYPHKLYGVMAYVMPFKYHLLLIDL